MENGKNIAQISAALAAAVTGHDPSIAAHTALNAVTENSFAVVPVIIGAVTLWEAYDLYQVYDKHGPEAALQELVKAGIITIATAGAGKVAYKVGAKIYPSAEAAFKAYKTQSPALTKVVEGLSAGADHTKDFAAKMIRLGKGEKVIFDETLNLLAAPK